MKLHQHSPSTYPKPLAKIAMLALVSLPALFLLTACGNDPASNSNLDAVQDNSSVGFYESRFSFPEDEHPKIPGSTLSYMLMTDPLTKESRAYAIDCRGQSADRVALAFGADASNPFIGPDSYETLERDYKISEQPILRCSSMQPLELTKPTIELFHLIDDRPADKKKEKTLPQVFARFNNLTADDANNEEQFYSVGCIQFINSFGTFLHAIGLSTPILASSAASIFPDFENYRPLNCMKNTNSVNFYWPVLASTYPKGTKKTTYEITQRGLEFYRVVDFQDSAKTISYLVGLGNAYNRIACPNVRDHEIKEALNFPSDHLTFDLNSDDSRYLNSLSRPVMECVNIQSRERFESRWSTVHEAPAVNFYKRKDTKTLYRFGCPSAERYFTSGLQMSSGPLQVESDLVRYLAETPRTGYQLVTFPCYGSGLAVDPKALTSGEVISLSLPSAPDDKKWLEGNTVNAVIAQRNEKNSGSYWLVTSTDDDASFTIQSFGRNPGMTYLACPAMGNTPKLVKLANDPDHSTKWTAFRGDGDSTVRLGCRDGNGELKLLNGGGGTLTSVSGENTGADAGTNWRVEHQTFVEDSNFLKPGAIVSFYSLTTGGKPWLAAYPGKPQEAGLELLATSPATYFRVEKRSDNRGVSLISLNKGAGHTYLECNTELGGLQLAPGSTGGTGFKAYKLTNSIHTIFKLACFGSTVDDRYWVASNGSKATLLGDGSLSESNMDSIFYLQSRSGLPTF